jgi:glutamate racemase
MKIGIFDSGLGGLFLASHIRKVLPDYDYLYLGDLKRLPYGTKTPATIYKYLKEAVDYLFAYDCQIIIVACNTASAVALKDLREKYLLKHYPERRVFGIIVPTLEALLKTQYKKVGLLATPATVRSRAFVMELKKLSSTIKLTQSAAPELASLIEEGKTSEIDEALRKYLKPLQNCQAIILACTHYSIVKAQIKKLLGKRALISQTEIIPATLKQYLASHEAMRAKLSRRGTITLLATKITPSLSKRAKEWFGAKTRLTEIKL